MFFLFVYQDVSVKQCYVQNLEYHHLAIASYMMIKYMF